MVVGGGVPYRVKIKPKIKTKRFPSPRHAGVCTIVYVWVPTVGVSAEKVTVVVCGALVETVTTVVCDVVTMVVTVTLLGAVAGAVVVSVAVAPGADALQPMPRDLRNVMSGGGRQVDG